MQKKYFIKTTFKENKKEYKAGTFHILENPPLDKVCEISDSITDYNNPVKEELVVVEKPKKVRRTSGKIADIIIPHHNRHDRLFECLNSFENDIFNIIIVSGSDFAVNCNKGAKLATTDNLIFLNDDIIVAEGALEELCEKPEDIVGVPLKIINSGKVVYGMNMHWGKYGASTVLEGFDSVKTALEFNSFDNCKIPVTGGFFRIKKKAWEELGGFKEFYKNGGEDNHLFLEALEKGFTIGHIDKICNHYHSSSEGRYDNDVVNHQILTQNFPLERLYKILGDGAKGELVSVIIPTVNKGRPFCLDSLEKQTHPNIEIIISRDPKRKGANWARNKGLKKAKGEYVFFADEDCEFKKQIIETMLNSLRNTKNSFAYCNYKREGELDGTHFAKPWDYNELKKFNYISTMSLIRKKDFNGWDEDINRFQDWDVWLEMASRGKKGVHINHTLFTANYKKGDISCEPKTFKKSLDKIRNKWNLTL